MRRESRAEPPASCSRRRAPRTSPDGGARFSRKHANFVENTGEASTADVLAVLAEGRRRVHERFGVVARARGPDPGRGRMARRVAAGGADARADETVPDEPISGSHACRQEPRDLALSPRSRGPLARGAGRRLRLLASGLLAGGGHRCRGRRRHQRRYRGDHRRDHSRVEVDDDPERATRRRSSARPPEFPTIASVSVDANFPHGLRIEVDERPPALVVSAGEREVPVAGDGTLLTGVSRRRGRSSPFWRSRRFPAAACSAASRCSRRWSSEPRRRSCFP